MTHWTRFSQRPVETQCCRDDTKVETIVFVVADSMTSPLSGSSQDAAEGSWFNSAPCTCNNITEMPMMPYWRPHRSDITSNGCCEATNKRSHCLIDDNTISDNKRSCDKKCYDSSDNNVFVTTEGDKYDTTTADPKTNNGQASANSVVVQSSPVVKIGGAKKIVPVPSCQSCLIATYRYQMPPSASQDTSPVTGPGGYSNYWPHKDRSFNLTRVPDAGDSDDDADLLDVPELEYRR